jgi:hypothetical protein
VRPVGLGHVLRQSGVSTALVGAQMRGHALAPEELLRDNQDDTRDNQDGKFLIGRFPKLLARI